MKFNIKRKEEDLIRVALLDVVVNSSNFNEFEKERLANIYRRIIGKQERRDRRLNKWD